MYDIEYNGILSSTLGVAVTKRPDIPTPEQRGELVQIAGRDGGLLVSDGTYDVIEIGVDMNFVRAPKFWGETYRLVKNWLSGSGILRLGDDSGWHYRVIQAKVSTLQRTTWLGHNFEAGFICDPFSYKDGGDSFLSVEQVLNNPYFEARPIYYIEGNGECTLTVNGNEVTADVDGNLIINCEKMLAYKDGVQANASITGDYDGLFLKSGLNEISITDGFAISIAPNWRSL